MKFFYDLEDRVTAIISECEEISRINLYSYDDDNNITSFVNNGDIYHITYAEDGTMEAVDVNGILLERITTDGNCTYYGNGDVKSLRTGGKANRYIEAINGHDTLEYILDDYGLIVYAKNVESGIDYSYEYNNNLYISSVTSNTGFSSVYSYSEDEINISYSDGNSIKQQVINTTVPETVNVQLLSGASLREYYESNIL